MNLTSVGFVTESTQLCELTSNRARTGYRSKRTGHQGVARVAEAIVQHKARVIDLDLANYFGAPGLAWRFQRMQFTATRPDSGPGPCPLRRTGTSELGQSIQAELSA